MIKIKNVTKTFGDVKAVDQITLTIQNGLVFGMLGTNGAGKSTLLRMMAGVTGFRTDLCGWRTDMG